MRRRSWVAMVAPPLLTVLALSLAGCGKKGDDGDGVATANGAARPSATATGSADGMSMQDRMIKFAQCMREHGIDMPDPEVNDDGTFGIQIGGGGDAPMDKTKVDAANEACRQYAPNGGSNAQADPAMNEKLRAMAKCMRANGVPNFPDPSEDGGIMIEKGAGIDPGDPKFQETQQKCNQEAGMPTTGPMVQGSQP